MARPVLARFAALLIAATGLVEAANADWYRRFDLRYANPVAIRALSDNRIAVVVSGLPSAVFLLDGAGEVQSAVQLSRPVRRAAITASGEVFICSDRPNVVTVTKLKNDLSVMWDRSISGFDSTNVVLSAVAGAADGGVVVVGADDSGPFAVRLDGSGG